MYYSTELLCESEEFEGIDNCLSMLIALKEDLPQLLWMKMRIMIPAELLSAGQVQAV